MKRCRGCNRPPVDAGTFGRHKFVCRSYQERNRKKVTAACNGGQMRPSWHEPWLAEEEWNDLQRNAVP